MDTTVFRGRAEDSIEREMACGVEVVHHDKGIARGAPALALIYAALAGSTSTAALMAGAPLWTLALPAVLSVTLGVFTIMKAVVRTTVTSDHVVVRSGMKERRVAVGAISKVQILERSAIAPRGVLVSYDAGGATQQLWMASQDPEVLVSAIEHVRSAAGPRARVHVEPAEAVEVEHEEMIEDRKRAR